MASHVVRWWLAGLLGFALAWPPVLAAAMTDDPTPRSFVDAMKPRRDGRPVVAVLAANAGTEMTDLLLPHAVLQRSGVVDVQIVAPRSGAVTLYPALQIDGAQDFAAFDRAHPRGPDYVIVPAMEPDDNAEVIAWLRAQANRGARVIGVCVGALVVARAGLLDGRRFTTHWYYRDKALKLAKGAAFVPNQRYVVDRGVATTTGITASVPTMIALVEAIAGRERARALADELGVESWAAAHDSARFGLNGARRWAYVVDKAAFWRDERWAVDVHDGLDDIALALAADAWSRTGLIDVEAAAAGTVRLRSGLRLSAHAAAPNMPRLPLSPTLKPLQQLERTLCEIDVRFGDARRDRVEQEMEYPAAAQSCAP